MVVLEMWWRVGGKASWKAAAPAAAAADDGVATRDAVRRVLVGFSAITALVAAGTGWLLASEGGYAGDTITYHRYLALAFATCITIAAFAARVEHRPAYVVAFFGSLVLLLPAAHFGASMTHGDGFLTKPLRAGPSLSAEDTERAVDTERADDTQRADSAGPLQAPGQPEPPARTARAELLNREGAA